MAAEKDKADGFQMNRLLKTIVVVSIAAAALSACGRRGPLEAPSAAANPANGEKVEAAPVEDKPFILDGFIK